MLRAFVILSLVLAIAVAPYGVTAQQGGTTLYVYDRDGRLRATISPAGEAAVYEYDPAGNFTRIRRVPADGLELLDFFPKEGLPDDLVTFIGVGFGAGVNSVSFNGAAAQVVETTLTSVVARVPTGATTGPVTIDTARGTVVTAEPFTIRGVRVIPSTARLFPGDSVQFAAFVVVAGGDTSVVWSVNGVEGGNQAVGTITTAGLYTAPNQADPSITVQATSVADPLLFGQARVNVQDIGLVRAALASAVSVRVGPPLPVMAAQVSVRINPLSALASPVSVRVGPPLMLDGARVSVSTGPHISSIAPGSFIIGSGGQVTINGTNFGGATALTFFTTAGALDSSITVSGLMVNGAGTSLTANLTVSGSAASGRRIVVVTTPAASSQLADLGLNTIEIIQ